jgi:hypothetical protein
MWQFFKNIIDRIVAGTDRELLRIQDSRKYFITWSGTLLITIGYALLIFLGDFKLSFDDAFKVLQDWAETLIILWGLYMGVNAYLDGKSNKTTTINEHVEHTYKVTNNEDESDPEKMNL